MTKEYYYSEIFRSIQGEGVYTGIPTAWVRFYLCNLQCNGFGQEDPTDPSTYELPYQKIDLKDISRVEDLPVFEKGCDSSYTWSKRFKHLMHKGDANHIVNEIQNVMRSPFNPAGTFYNPESWQTAHLCFTGGEPLMKHAQQCAVEVINILREADNLPPSITWETNGTQKLTSDFISFFSNPANYPGEIVFSVSPKLWTVSGEKAKKAIQPECVAQYQELAYKTGGQGYLKFVMGTNEAHWYELENVINTFRDFGINWPVWIMPVSATVEGQQEIAGKVAEMAIERGYNVSARVHCYLFGNKIGT